MQNQKDKFNRKYILVQVPELTYKYKYGVKKAKKQSKKAFEQGFNNIFEIAKKRLILLNNEIKQNSRQLKLEEKSHNLDLGFKVFRVFDTTLNWEKAALQGEDI